MPKLSMNHMAKKTIFVIGSSNTDMILRVPSIPRPGETVLGGRFASEPGGKGANQAVAAARAGGRVVIMTSLGQDTFGDEYVRRFEMEGIETGFVLRDAAAASGVALIFVGANGENSIGVAPGANEGLRPEHIDAARDALAAASILLIQLEIPVDTVAAAVQLAHAHGVRVIMNPAPAQPLSEALLAKISVLTPNETEAALLSGIEVKDKASAERAGRALLEKGVGEVVLTMGRGGCLHITADAVRHYPAFSVTAVDTTAAGDTFNGALAVALAESRPIDNAIRFASAAAALSVMQEGAQGGIPDRSAINNLLQTSTDEGGFRSQ